MDETAMPAAGVPSDNTTLVDVLAVLRREGFTAAFAAVPGSSLVCSGCGSTFDASGVRVESIRRMEGASDPDDELVLVAGRCPTCACGGVAVLGFGPVASPADAAVVSRLPMEPGGTASPQSTVEWRE